MAESYLPFDRLYPYEKRRPRVRGDEELYEDHDEDFLGIGPYDRLYRYGLWYYFPPFAFGF